MNTAQKILLGVLLPLLVALVYLIYRIIAGKYLRKLYPTNDIEADRVKLALDQGDRPPPTDFHSTALDYVSRMSWQGLLTGKHDTADALGYTTSPPRTPRTRRNTSESTRTILRRTPNQSSRSLVTGYESGEEYEMHPTTVPINVPAPPTFIHPHLASSLGTQAPPQALFARQSSPAPTPSSPRSSPGARGRASSDPFLDGSPSSLPRPSPARVRALSGGGGAGPSTPRRGAAGLGLGRGSPLRTTVRPESVGEPMPPIPAQFASPVSVSGGGRGRGGWRVFPPRSSVEELRGMGKGKERAVEE